MPEPGVRPPAHGYPLNSPPVLSCAHPMPEAFAVATPSGARIRLESLAWIGVFSFPTGVSATARALASSIPVFIVVSMATSGRDPGPDADIRPLIDSTSGA